MFERVLVGVDGKSGGRDAIALAKELRGRSGQITLVHVWHGDSNVWGGGNPTHWPMERQEAEAMLRSASEEAGVKASRLYSVPPPVGRGLHELAEDIRADLLVVGSSTRSFLGRVMVGDDTRAALNGAPCAVAVAPAGYGNEPHLLREVGVAYNGSPESQHALAMARRVAAAHGATLSAFEAVWIPSYVYMSTGAPGVDVVAAMLEDARTRIERAGAIPHAAFGSPAEELSVYSASLDLLVVGSRGYGPIGRLVHGSTSQAMARRARCPLLVLTRAARAADDRWAGVNGHKPDRAREPAAR
jgi:nucleotide-binding universal stress UspA family protein